MMLNSHDDKVEMAPNPAYGTVATALDKKEVQYEEVAPTGGGYKN